MWTTTERKSNAHPHFNSCLRWFCNGCWQSWEDERRERRLSTGKLLPEDRELWYSNTVRPIKLFDYEDPLSVRLALNDQFMADSEWLKVDMHSLTIETYIGDEPPNSAEPSVSSFLSNVDEKPKQVAVGECSWYKSLNWRVGMDTEFLFDFSNTTITIGSPEYPLTSLRDSPYFHFPKHVLSDSFVKFREMARQARKHKLMIAEMEERKQAEREEQRRKQQIELQQKQKDLVQLAIKRAQNKKPAPAGTPPPPPVKSNVWSSSAAVPVVLVQHPAVGAQWSSRPMVPPPIPTWSAQQAPPVQLMMAPLLPPMHDPWSSAAAKAWSPEPETKRSRSQEKVVEESNGDKRQRMARLGVPFRPE